MTSAELRAALATLGWTGGILALRTGMNRQTVHRWMTGKHQPPRVVQHWLTAMVAHYEAHPPPLLSRDGRERVQRQPRGAKLAEEEHRAAGLVTPDADHHAPESLSRPVPDPEGIPSGWYRPPG